MIARLVMNCTSMTSPSGVDSTGPVDSRFLPCRTRFQRPRRRSPDFRSATSRAACSIRARSSYGAHSTTLSLRHGRRVAIRPPTTIADGLAHPTPSPGPFAVNRRLLHEIVTVDDGAIAEAMALCLRQLNVVVEPSGACALAALVAGKRPVGCGRIAVVLSGGNVDWVIFRTLIDDIHARRPGGLRGMSLRPGTVPNAGAS